MTFSASSGGPRGDQEKIIVKCPACQTRMAVRRAHESQMVKCPRCAKHLRVGAPKPKQARAQRPAMPKPSTARAPARQFARPEPTPDGPFDPDWESLTGTDLAPAVPFHARQAPPEPGGNFVQDSLLWMNGHRWITIIGGLNLIFLVMTLLLRQTVPIGSVVAGAVLIGLLQVPRQYVVERTMDWLGSAIASMTVGSVIFGMLIGTVRIMLRLSRRDQPIDFSHWPMVVVSLSVALVVFIVFVVLWHHIGLFRLLAGLYVARMGLMIISMLMVMRWEGLIQVQAPDLGLAGAEQRLEERDRRRFPEPRRHPAADDPRLADPRHSEPRLADEGNAEAARVPPSWEGLSGRDLWLAKQQGELRLEFRFDPEDPDMQPERLSARVLGRASNPRFYYTGQSDNLVLLVNYPGSMEEFASLFNVGTITRLDEESREIDIDLRSPP